MGWGKMTFHCCFNSYFYPNFLLTAAMASLGSSYVLVKQWGVSSRDLFHPAPQIPAGEKAWDSAEVPSSVHGLTLPGSGPYTGNACSICLCSIRPCREVLQRCREMITSSLSPCCLFSCCTCCTLFLSIVFKYEDLNCGILIVHMCF